MDLDAWLTPSQAARALGISRQLFNDWRSRGRIKPNERGLCLCREVVDLEHKTRTCTRPGVWRRGQQSAVV
jgi:hypothetical protein